VELLVACIRAIGAFPKNISITFSRVTRMAYSPRLWLMAIGW